MNGIRLYTIIGAGIVVSYLLRSSIMVWIIPDREMALASYCVFGLGSLLIILNRSRVSMACALALISFLPGSYFSDQPTASLLKLGGLALLVSAVGPLFPGGYGSRIRNSSWNTLRLAAAGIGGASFFWWLLRLPLLGVGSFTGIMLYSNTLGPIASLGALFSLCRAIEVRGHFLAKYWYGAAALGTIACFLSASRASIAALLGAVICIAVAWKMKTRKSFSKWIIPGVIVMALGYGVFVKAERFSSVRELLAAKNEERTRETVWEARWNDFRENPLFGVGVGYTLARDDNAGVLVKDDGSLNVEPGSSYLAILAMAGCSGMVGMAILFCSIIGKAWSTWQKIPLGKALELTGVGCFMALNGIAEGWVLAVGSPLCIVFWLWLGHSVDVLDFYDSAWKKKTLKNKSHLAYGKARVSSC